jgi:hypothetical protein
VAIDREGFLRAVKVGWAGVACGASLETGVTVVALKFFRIAPQVGHEYEMGPYYTLRWHVRSEFRSGIGREHRIMIGDDPVVVPLKVSEDDLKVVCAKWVRLEWMRTSGVEVSALNR